MKFTELNLAEFATMAASLIRNDRTIVLAGAGISMARPTTLPSGDELRDLAVKSLCSSRSLRHWWAILSTRSDYRALLPELVFQRLWEYIGDDLSSFFDILRPATPNEIHQLLASISGLFRTPIATTNFELLIEDAGASDETIHLHGSLHQPGEMVVRLNQVGRPIPIEVTASFLDAVADRSILVLGYSGRDTDVMRLLSRSAAREVLWLTRGPVDPALTLAEAYSLEIIAASGDLTELARLLSSILGLASAPRSFTPVPDLKSERDRILARWRRSIRIDKKRLALAATFLAAGDFGAASKIATEGVDFCNPTFKGEYQIATAGILRLTARFDKGLELIRQTLVHHDDSLSRVERAKALNIAGLLFLEKRRPAPIKALRSLRSAERLLDENSEGDEEKMQLLCRVLNNVGLANDMLDRLDAAIAAYRKSLVIKRKLGDLAGAAQSSANLAITLYRQKRFSASYYWRQKAVSAADRYGLDFLRAYLSRRIGVIACHQGRLTYGRRKLNEALNLAKSIYGAAFDEKLIKKALGHYA